VLCGKEAPASFALGEGKQTHTSAGALKIFDDRGQHLMLVRMGGGSPKPNQINEGFLPRAGLQETFFINLIHANAMLHR